MRYYRIDITNAENGKPLLPASLKGMPLSTLLPNGQVNTSALDIELDVPVASFHAPAGGAFLRIHGLSVADVGASFCLNKQYVSIYAGMSKGLPLASRQAAQAGLLVKGMILPGFGNWIGTDQSIDMYLQPQAGSVAAPQNFALNWKAGTTLATALTGTLASGLPTAVQRIAVNPRLTLSYDVVAIYGSLVELNSFLHPFSQSVIGDTNYPGVSITYDGVTVKAFDGSGPSGNVTAIAWTDLIGQPTWIDLNLIQVTTVMRADLQVGSVVSLPQTLVMNTQQNALATMGLNPAERLNFTGNFVVTNIHHYGNFRQPLGSAWTSTFNMRSQSVGEA